MPKLLLVLLFAVNCHAAVFGSLVPAAKWYVDSVAGSDSNNGTSVATPFQTIAKVLEQTTNAKECIALKRGSHWREKMTLPNAWVCVVAYGSTTVDRPLLDCSEIISTLAWSKTAGRTNIYQATVATDNELSAFLRAWEDDAALFKATSLDNLDATPARYYTATDGGTSYVLYVHATGSGNPASNGKVYEYNKRSYGLFSQYDNHTISGIHTRRNLGNNGSFEVGRFSFVNDVKAEDGTKHNALAKEGSTWVDVTLLNSMYFPGQSRIALVLFDNASAGYDTLFKRITYTENLEAGVGFFGHDSTGNLTGTVTLKDCVTNGSVGASTSISGFNTARMVVDGGSYNAAISMGSPVSIARNLTISGQLSIPYGNVSVEIDTVTAAGSSIANGTIGIANSITGLSLSVHNSTLGNTRPFDDSIYFGTGCQLDALSIQDNNFQQQVNHFGGPGTAGMPLNAAINGNTYHYPPATSSYVTYRGAFYDISILAPSGWTAWQLLGFDATGSRVTP